MNRWTRQALQGLVLCAAWAAATSSFAQGLTREAPKDVTPAIIAVGHTPPDITVNGKPDRLSPGSRIRDVNNMLVLSGGLAGKSLYTVYRRDAAGLVHEVWLLTAAEYEKLGGADQGSPEGYKRFYEFLNLIFAARMAGVGK